MDYYLKLGSGSDLVLGECREPHHVGWIKLHDFAPEDMSYRSIPGAGADISLPIRFRVEMVTTKTTGRITNLITSLEKFSLCTVDVVNAGAILYQGDEVRLTWFSP